MGLGIKGFLPATMLDWDGKLATTLFSGGCNLRCPYCHNPELISSSTLPDIDFSLIEKHIKDKSGWLDGVVVTGGEPLVNPRITELLQRLKSLGCNIKLDTNGTLPGVLVELFKKKLVDYVALDVKSSLAKYRLVADSDLHQNIKKSMQLIVESGIPNEFRTTMVPGIVDAKDVLATLDLIKGGDAYFLQQFSSQQVLEPRANNVVKYPDRMLIELAEKCSKVIPTKVRGIAKKHSMKKAV